MNSAKSKCGKTVQHSYGTDSEKKLGNWQKHENIAHNFAHLASPWKEIGIEML